MNDFIATYYDPKLRVDNQLDRKNKQLEQKNKHILGRIIDAVKLCGMQGIALRGHRDDKVIMGNENDTRNPGNFHVILQNMAKTDNILREHLENQNNKCEKYTSKTIQNEIIDVIKELITEKLLEPLKECKYYSIMCDEVTDASNTEVLSLCIRLLDKRNKKEIKINEVILLHIFQ